MLEDIKTDILKQTEIDCNCGSNGVYEDCVVYVANIMRILDKYSDLVYESYAELQDKLDYKTIELDKYKSAWEELKTYQKDLDEINKHTLFKDNNGQYNFQRGMIMSCLNMTQKVKELGQKYKIGSEN